MVSVAKSVSWSGCVFACLLAARSPSQEGLRYFVPEKFERATKTDDAGLVQWADHTKQKCPSCSGSGKTKCTTCVRFPDDWTICPECKRTKDREVVCRTCGGTGAFPDPLEKVHCPGCMAAGFLICTVCSGAGQQRVGDAKKPTNCPSCRGDGGFKCQVCNGSRLVEVAALKPSLREASAATLAKGIATTDQTLKALAAVTPSGGQNSRKEVKAIGKALEIGQSIFPPIKRTPKFLEDCMGRIYGGANFQGHEENEAQAMALVKGNAEYFLKHQKRMMELAHKRAETNEKLQAENKGK